MNRSVSLVAAPVLVAGAVVLIVLLRGETGSGPSVQQERIVVRIDVANPVTVPDLPIVVEVAILNESPRPRKVGDPGPMNDALRLYFGPPGGDATGMYSHWRFPGTDDDLTGRVIRMEAGQEFTRYFFVYLPPGEHEIWVEYAWMAGKRASASRVGVACGTPPGPTDELVERITLLSSGEGDTVSPAADELRGILRGGQPRGIRLLALAGLARLLGKGALQDAATTSQNVEESTGFRDGALEVQRRIEGTWPHDPVRPH